MVSILHVRYRDGCIWYAIVYHCIHRNRNAILCQNLQDAVGWIVFSSIRFVFCFFFIVIFLFLFLLFYYFAVSVVALLVLLLRLLLLLFVLLLFIMLLLLLHTHREGEKHTDRQTDSYTNSEWEKEEGKKILVCCCNVISCISFRSWLEIQDTIWIV